MVSAWVKATRQQRRWSQAELARRADVTRLTIVLLEDHPDARPGATTLSKLAQAFGLSVGELIQAATPGSPAAPAEAGRSRADDWIAALAALEAELTPAECAALLAQARVWHRRHRPTV